MNFLLLTLGHGSSALFVYNEGKTVIGYEQERLSGIKSDSQFPIDAINEIRHNVGSELMKNCKILISHWFNLVDNFVPNKYITKTDLINLADISTDIRFCNESFTHHDAHAYSAFAFFKDNYNMNAVLPSTTGEPFIIVADGFGINEEVISIYKITREPYSNRREPSLIKRVYGFDASVGLMYQYATSFCGMKENQDEYKFLGYEAHIDEFLSESDIRILNHNVEVNVDYLYNKLQTQTEISKSINSICDIKKLGITKQFWYEVFNNVLNNCFVEYNDEFKKRCVIAYFIQQSVEIYFKKIIDAFEMKSVIVSGGCFYNVKLNNHILNSIKGLFCAMPLAGDQGAAIGMYEKFAKKKFPFGNLCFGKRRMNNANKMLSGKEKDGIYFRSVDCPSDYDNIAAEIVRFISDGNIVNVVHGNMEFGPRALGHTSSIFLPTTENVAANNYMNMRNEVMPCAPICTHDNAKLLFENEQYNRVIGSLYYMICTLDYTKAYSNQYGGVMHKKTLYDVYTGRPQIVDNGRFMYGILKAVEIICDAKCLVNTSFNVHGRPIAFSLNDVLQNFYFQKEHAKEGKSPILFVIEE